MNATQNRGLVVRPPSISQTSMVALPSTPGGTPGTLPPVGRRDERLLECEKGKFCVPQGKIIAVTEV